MSSRPSVIPCLIYDDALGAIDFLCEAFGFTRHLVVPGGDDEPVAHAQLTLGGSMVMLSSAKPMTRERFGMVTPKVTGGMVTTSVYVVVDDLDAHHAHAAAAGAPIIDPPEGKEYGGRGYNARDLEGNFWSFGSYDPWAG